MSPWITLAVFIAIIIGLDLMTTFSAKLEEGA